MYTVHAPGYLHIIWLRMVPDWVVVRPPRYQSTYCNYVLDLLLFPRRV